MIIRSVLTWAALKNTIDGVALTTDTYFLTILDAVSLSLECLHGWVLVRTGFWGGLPSWFVGSHLLCVHMTSSLGALREVVL